MLHGSVYLVTLLFFFFSFFFVRLRVTNIYLNLVSVVCVQLGPKFMKETGLKHLMKTLDY